jgi:hypothetical protein
LKTVRADKDDKEEGEDAETSGLNRGSPHRKTKKLEHTLRQKSFFASGVKGTD